MKLTLALLTSLYSFSAVYAGPPTYLEVRPTQLDCFVTEPSMSQFGPRPLPAQKLVTQELSPNYYRTSASAHYILQLDAGHTLSIVAVAQFDEASAGQPSKTAVPKNARIDYTVTDSVTGVEMHSFDEAKATIQAPPLPPAHSVVIKGLRFNFPNRTDAAFGCALE